MEKLKIYSLVMLLLASASLLSCNKEESKWNDETVIGFSVQQNETDAGLLSKTRSSSGKVATDAGTPLHLISTEDTLFVYSTMAEGINMGKEESGNTRSTPVTTGNFESVYGGFNVNAYLNGQTFITDDQTSKSGEYYATTGKTYYWPGDESLDFYAYAPKDLFSAGTGASNYNIDPSAKKITFSYQLPEPDGNTNDANDAVKQKDILLFYSSCNKGESNNGAVPVAFDHPLSAVRFKAGDVTTGTIKRITIKNVYGSGSCTYDLSSSDPVKWSLTGSQNMSYTQKFNAQVRDKVESSISSDENGTVFMMLPQELGETTQIEVILETAGEEKLLTGVIGGDGQEWLPGYSYEYTISSTSIHWEYVFEVMDRLLVPHSQLAVSYEVVSYRQRKGDNSIKESVPWSATLSDGVNTDNSIVPSTTFIPDFTYSGNGSVSPSVYNINVFAKEMTTDCAGDRELTDATPKGTEVAPYDLSKYDTDGNSITRSTANCYVVRGPGVYSFPLYYGNAIKNGAANASAYTYQGSGDSHILNTMVNHQNSAISASQIQGVHDAVLVWQDAYNLLKYVKIATVNGEQMVVFSLNEDFMQQGNIVLAVRNSSGVILWSWHIWVTEHRLTDTYTLDDYDNSSNKYYLAPYNLGWCDPKVTVFMGREGTATFTQNGSGTVKSMQVVQEEYTWATTSGNNIYYQFGRKDPILGIKNRNEGIKYHFYTNENYAYKVVENGPVNTIGTSIQNPNVLYLAEQGTNQRLWLTDEYNCNNLWNNRDISNQGKQVIKTVYDPSPVGFVLPPRDAFRIITTTGANAENNITLFNGYLDTQYQYYYWLYPKKGKQGTPFMLEATGGRWFGTNTSISANWKAGDNYNINYVYLWMADAYPGDSESHRNGGYSTAIAISDSENVYYPMFSGSRNIARPARPIKEQ